GLEPGGTAGAQPAVVFPAGRVVQRLGAASRVWACAQLDWSGRRAHGRSLFPVRWVRSVSVPDRNVSGRDALVPQPVVGGADDEARRVGADAGCGFRRSDADPYAGSSRRAAGRRTGGKTSGARIA